MFYIQGSQRNSHTRFILANQNFNRLKVIPRLKDESWCMDLAFVDKLAEKDIGLKYLLVRQDWFDRTVDAKGKKTKVYK